MKQKILLVDDSLTVQKVVALSLDRNYYQILFAKNQSEALRSMAENEIGVALISESVSGLSTAFPKEAELRLGRNRRVPPMCLISLRPDAGDRKHYAATIQKPFTPQTLTQMIESVLGASPPPVHPMTGHCDEPERGTEEERLHQVFNEAFPHESILVEETLRHSEEQSDHSSELTPVSSDEPAPLWDTLGGSDMIPMKLPSQPTEAVRPHPLEENLDSLVAKKLDQVLPAIVERLVQERLDKLLAAQDSETKA